MSDYITKDSGAREDFASGARRDTQSGKPRYDLIPPGPLKRLAELYERGAVKYGDSNWEKGMPCSRIIASLMRHVEQFREGDRTEDHLAAVAWNAFALIYFEGTRWDDTRKWGPNDKAIPLEEVSFATSPFDAMSPTLRVSVPREEDK